MEAPVAMLIQRAHHALFAAGVARRAEQLCSQVHSSSYVTAGWNGVDAKTAFCDEGEQQRLIQKGGYDGLEFDSSC